MKIGLFCPFPSPFATRDFLAALGPAAEQRGFHSLWVGEHVVLFDRYASEYPYAPDGKLPGGAENGLLEPFTAIAFLAAITETLRLGTGICILPQRNPVYTAKEVTTVDWLSNGRFDFGVGIGWLEEEYEVLNTPFARRGKRCRTYLEVMKRLWTEEVAEYEDELYRLPACRQDPKPIQRPHPPIVFGGESDPALRRVADLGQGWHGFDMEPEALAERLGVLTGLLEERGRRRDEIEVTTCGYFRPPSLDLVKRYRDAGADQVTLLAVGLDADSLLPTLDFFAESIVEPARAL